MRLRLDRLAPLALAAALGALAAAPAMAGSMTVALNHSVKLGLAGPAGSVVVGNPAIADVTVIDSRTVYVSGRGPGSTDVAVLDPLGRILFSGDVRVTNEAGAHVVVHRGVGAVADMACDPTCVQASTTSVGSPQAAPSTGGMLGAATTGAIGGAVAGVMGASSSSSGASAVHPS